MNIQRKAFLAEAELSKCIRQVAKGADGCFAVAFWGDGAVEELFGKPSKLRQSARIICDIGLGGTNPKELEKLGAPRSKKVRFLKGLHSKIYLSAEGAVIGSANASDNGIGFLSEAGKLVEAGVFCATREASYDDASRWFEELWKRSKQVDAAALKIAKQLFKSRMSAAMRGGFAPLPSKRSQSVLDLAVSTPAIFGECGFVVSNTLVPKKTQLENIARDSAEMPEFELSEYMQFDGWGEDCFRRWPDEFVSIFLSGTTCGTRVYRKVAVSPKDSPRTLYAERKMSGDIFSLVNRRMSPSATAIHDLLEKEETFFQNVHEFSESLDTW